MIISIRSIVYWFKNNNLVTAFLVIFYIIIFPGILFIFASALSKGKPFGYSNPISTYKVNYSYDCTASGSTVDNGTSIMILGRNCKKFIESRDQRGDYIVPTTIDGNAAAIAMKIPFIDDFFPKNICVEMDPYMLGHWVYLLLENRFPGIQNHAKYQTFSIKVDRNPKCTFLSVDQYLAINSMVQSVDFGKKVPTETEVQQNELAAIGPELDGEDQELALISPYDDNDHQSTATLTIEYVNKKIALTMIWIVSIFLSISTISFIFMRSQYYFSIATKRFEQSDLTFEIKFKRASKSKS